MSEREWMAHAGPPPSKPDPEDAPPIDTDVPDELGGDFAMNVELAATEAAVDDETLAPPTVHDAPPDLFEKVEEEVHAIETPGFPVVEGDMLQTMEWYFPVVWAGMLMIVCYIGIYYAVDHLPGGNPLPPSLQF